MEQIFKVFYDEKMTIGEKIGVFEGLKIFLCNHHAMSNVADDLIDKLIEILIRQSKE